jgi:hypothetical protein
MGQRTKYTIGQGKGGENGFAAAHITGQYDLIRSMFHL